MQMKPPEILLLNFDRRAERISEKFPYIKFLSGDLNQGRVKDIKGVVVNLEGKEYERVAREVLHRYPSVPHFGIVSKEIKRFKPRLLRMGFEGVEDSPLDEDKIERIVISVLWGNSGDGALNSFMKEILAFVLNTRSENAVMKRIAECLLRIFKSDRVSIMLLDKKSNMLRIRSAVGIPDRVIKLRGKKLGEKISGWVAAQIQPLILQNGLSKYSEFQDVKGNPLVKSSMIIPMSFCNRTYGVINFTRLKGSAFTRGDKDRAVLYASFIAMILHQLKELEGVEILKKALNDGSEGVIIIDSDGRVVLMSRGARRIFRIDSENLINSRLYDILSPMMDEVDLKKITSGNKITNLQINLGKDRLLLLSSSPVKTEAGKKYGTLITVRELTEVINLQRDLINVEKLHELTKWVDEIAHHMNNPLSVIMGNIHLIEDIIKGVSQKGILSRDSYEKLLAETKKIITEISDASERISMFVRTLKNYNIDMDVHRERAFLQEIIDRAVDISDIENLKRIEFVKRYEINPSILCIRDRIIGAFVTILKNVLQASPEDEKIYITLSKMRKRPVVEINSRYEYIPDRDLNEDPLSSFYTAMNIPEGLQRGYGLVSSVINLHGGLLEFGVQEGKKLKVHIEFPEEE